MDDVKIKDVDGKFIKIGDRVAFMHYKSVSVGVVQRFTEKSIIIDYMRRSSVSSHSVTHATCSWKVAVLGR